MKIIYDGKYPTLCMGRLIVVIDGKEWRFPDYCLESGGAAYIDDDGFDITEQGPWEISSWPKNFPEDLKNTVIDLVNKNIDYGCCGGCI